MLIASCYFKCRSTVGQTTLMLLEGTNLNNGNLTWPCPSSLNGTLNFNTSPFPTGSITSMNGIVFANVIEFDDSSNDVDFIPTGPSNNVLSVAPFSSLTWAAPVSSNGIVQFNGWSNMMNVSINITLEADSGRESVYPALSYTALSSVVSLVIANYTYTNPEQWTSKLAVETLLPSGYGVRSKWEAIQRMMAWQQKASDFFYR